MRRFGVLLTALAFVAASLPIHTALADNFPNKPIRLIVPWPAGGSTDVLARIFAEKLTKELGQQVLVDNRSGANGIIGTEAAAKSPPDGYTMLLVSVEHVVNAGIYKSLPFDAIADFVPITDLTTQHFSLVANPSAGNSLSELIANAKAKPGKLTFASWGEGSLGHLAGELFKHRVGIDMLHVPYKGGPPAITDIMGGRVTMMFATFPISLPHIRTGKLKSHGLTASARSPVLPDVPTFAEAGVKGLEIDSWRGLVAPVGTPKSAIDILNAKSRNALGDKELRKKLDDLGFDILGSTPEDFAKRLLSEKDRWVGVVREAGIKPR